MVDKRKVSYEEGEDLAKSFKLNFIEASAKSATNIDQSFKEMAKSIMLRVNASSMKKEHDKKKIRLNEHVMEKDKPEKSSSCC
jgi:hypothetical protein